MFRELFEKQITKTDTRIQQTAYGGMAIVLAVPFLLLGSYFTLAGFDFAPLPAKVNGPVCLIGIVGIVFAMCGGVLGNAAIGGLRRKRRFGQLKKRFSSQPWYADDPWDTRGISEFLFLRVCSCRILRGIRYLSIICSK